MNTERRRCRPGGGRLRRSAWLLLAIVLSACGSSSTPSEAPAGDAATTPTSEAPVSEAQEEPQPSPTKAGDEALPASEIYARVSPSIPLIETASAIGSGILIDGGYVVTNYHVVWPHDSAWIVFPDGTEFADVPVIGWDPFADLAVLGVVSPSAPPLRLADGEGLSPGSDVFLVGYPAEMDLFPEPSITSGVLSRVREWDRYEITMLQTDAQIAGGQSGGALVDSRGRVIGISTWSFEAGGFSVATSASDDAEIVDSLIADNEEFAFSDRRAPGGSGEFEVQVDLVNGWDTRTFYFEGLAGTTVSVELDGLSDGALAVSGPDGIILEVDDDYSGVEFGAVELFTDGVHYVTVSTWSGDLDDPASYALVSSVRLNPFHDPDDGVHLDVGHQIGAVIDHYGDIDWYTTTLAEGETVVFRTDAIATDTLLLVAPVGDAEASVTDDDSGSGLFAGSFNAEIVYTAPSNGDYYIIVADAVGEGGGSYFLAVDVDPALGPGDSVDVPVSDPGTDADYDYGYGSWQETATPIATGETVVGSIDNPDDVQVYSFEASEGEAYQIDVKPVTLEDPVATLYDENVVGLAHNDDFGDSLASRIVWVAETPGRYYIEVSGWSGTGTYELTLQDGATAVQLTHSPGDDWDPAWSPESSRIAFSSNRDGDHEIYVMNADGSGSTQLTNSPGDDWTPAWSPDGSRIAFSSNRDGDLDIYVMNADGSGSTQLTNNPGDDWTPRWSPDGSRIAFSSNRDGDLDIFVMNADGSGSTQLTNNPGDDLSPAWSPDGSRIAFSSNRDGDLDIFVMNADGSRSIRLTSNPGDDLSPAWSPDGSRIALDSYRDGDWKIYVMNADGSRSIRLTSNPGDDLSPAWSPDGSRIAFHSYRSGDPEIYVMRLNDQP